jgi:hypothetical protein
MPRVRASRRYRSRSARVYTRSTARLSPWLHASELAQPGQAGESDQLAAGAAEGVDGAMCVDVELRALAVELGLGVVARVREPARVLQAGGEHRGDEGHGYPSIVATAPSLTARHN